MATATTEPEIEIKYLDRETGAPIPRAIERFHTPELALLSIETIRTIQDQVRYARRRAGRAITDGNLDSLVFPAFCYTCGMSYEITDKDGKTREVYVIRRLHGLEEAIERLNRRAAKLGLSPVTFETLKTELVDDPESFGMRQFLLHHVTVNGPDVKVPGEWGFVGRLDHLDGGNVFMACEGQKIPEQYRDCPPRCDHCKTLRDRKATYIFRNNEGNHTQIGSSCMTDFFGHGTPEMWANSIEAMNFVSSIGRSCSDYEEGDEREYRSGGGDRGFRIDHIISIVCASVRQHGFVSVKTAEAQGRPSTKDIVSEWVSRRRGGEPPKNPITVSPEDELKAAAIIKWGRETLAARLDLSDFSANVATLLKSEVIKPEHIGVLAAGVQNYDAEHAPALKGFFGEIGKRYDLDLTVQKRHLVAARIHGEPDLVTFTLIDADSRQFQWRTNADAALASMVEGTQVKMRGSVKNFYTAKNGTESTTLTRCSARGPIKDAVIPPAAPERVEPAAPVDPSPLASPPRNNLKSNPSREKTWLFLANRKDQSGEIELAKPAETLDENKLRLAPLAEYFKTRSSDCGDFHAAVAEHLEAGFSLEELDEDIQAIVARLWAAKDGLKDSPGYNEALGGFAKRFGSPVAARKETVPSPVAPPKQLEAEPVVLDSGLGAPPRIENTGEITQDTFEPGIG